MPYAQTTATKKIAQLIKRVRLLSGGTSASKTISIELVLIGDAQADAKPTLTSVVSESFPHLKRGAMRDFLNILQEHNYFEDARWHKGEFIYTFPLVEYARHGDGRLRLEQGSPIPLRILNETGSRIEFFSADMPSKVRGPRRDRLFLNEANNVAKESWEQLLLRTRQYAFADWNPTNDFYMYEDFGLNDLNGIATATDPDTDFLILTYKDNEALEPAIVKDIEKRQMNKQWFNVYGKGIRGEVEGKIFTGWQIIDDIPHEARLMRRGLDFGYSNDPTVLVDIYYYNGGYIIDELLYRKGMHNKDIADVINAQPDAGTIVIADSAEPKSIDEIRSYGCNITGVVKRPGYVQRTSENSDIDYVQSQRMSLTKRSTNVIKSYRNFMWQTDKEGKILNDYDHFWSDGMMATIYGMSGLKPREEEDEPIESPLTSLIY